MKKFKKLLSIALSLCILAGFATTARAEDSLNNQKLAINLEFLNIMTEYSADIYSVEYLKLESKTIANIVEKSTNNKIDEYVEEYKYSRNNMRSSTGGYYDVTLYNYFYPSSANHSSTKMKALATVKVYRETIAGVTVNSIVGTDSVDQQLVGSGPYILEAQTNSFNNYTLGYCDVNVSGVLTASSSNTSGISVDILKSIGFNVSMQSSTNWNARLPYTKVIRIYA